MVKGLRKENNLKIERVLTNNAVIVKGKMGNSQIVCGKGIAFKKRPGDEIDDSLINRRYISTTDSTLSQQLEVLLQEIPVEYVVFSDEAVKLIKEELGARLNESFVISLADHIYETVRRTKENVFMPNGMRWEIKRFYEKEYEVASKIKARMEEQFSISIPEDETAYLTMHIVNSECANSTMTETVKMTKLIQDVIQIIRIHFGIALDEDSAYYYRFITHMKYAARRIIQHKQAHDQDNTDLAILVFTKYPEAYACVKKIAEFIQTRYHYSICDEERLFLTIHIQTLLRKAVLQN